MPYIGLSPFLRTDNKVHRKGRRCVNALHRAIPISTRLAKTGLMLKDLCVNALHRAIPISTVTSRNPHKQGAQFRNNSCNCQTIHFYPYFYSIFTPFFPSFDISAFFPKMVRLMTFLLYTFFDTGSSCFFLFRSFPMHLISWEYHKRHPHGCLYVICCLRFIWYLICCISIISPPISSYFLHSINSFLCTTTCYFIKIVVGNKTLIICSPPFAFHCFVLLKDFFQNFSNNKW